MKRPTSPFDPQPKDGWILALILIALFWALSHEGVETRPTRVWIQENSK